MVLAARVHGAKDKQLRRGRNGEKEPAGCEFANEAMAVQPPRLCKCPVWLLPLSLT
jgi:hypothetical protein